MMERLTERCAGGIRIKGCSTLYPDVERKGAPASNAIVRLAAYEDTMTLEQAQELAQAADALETLLAERDAAVEELHGRCSQCEHFHSWMLKFPCTDCCFEEGKSDHWQWRGPKKEA